MGSGNDIGADKEPWLMFLDQELAACEAENLDPGLFNILKDLLQVDSTITLAEGARLIDTYYWETFLPADPLAKFQEGKGMEAFLFHIHWAMADLAKHLHYDDSRQEMLMQVVSELRKLPPKTLKVFGTDCIMYTEEPVFSAVMEESWRGNTPSEKHEENSGVSYSEWEEECNRWVNYSSYLARCIKSGVNTHLDRCKYPDVDIEEGLEKDHPSQVIRNCKVMVAARYIILAGCIIHEDFVTTPAADSEDGRRGIEKWQLWAHKFKEIADKGDVSAEGCQATILVNKDLDIFDDLVKHGVRQAGTVKVEDLGYHRRHDRASNAVVGEASGP